MMMTQSPDPQWQVLTLNETGLNAVGVSSSLILRLRLCCVPADREIKMSARKQQLAVLRALIGTWRRPGFDWLLAR